MFTETLPTLEQCWLVDADGNHYTSELRTIGFRPISQWVSNALGLDKLVITVPTKFCSWKILAPTDATLLPET